VFVFSLYFCFVPSPVPPLLLSSLSLSLSLPEKKKLQKQEKETKKIEKFVPFMHKKILISEVYVSFEEKNKRS